MAWQASRHDEQSIDANVVAMAGVARREPLRGDRDPAQPIFVQRPGGRIFRVALLDLDKCDDAAAPRNQVDLASVNPQSLAENPPAAQPQPPGGDPLRPPSPRFRLLPVQLPPPSSS